MYGALKSFCDFWTSDIKTHKRGLTITAGLALLGYAGAATFYGYLLGFDMQHQWACPLCLHIISFGEPRDKFVGQMFVFGTINAITFLLLGWLLIGASKIWRRLFKARPPSATQL